MAQTLIYIKRRNKVNLLGDSLKFSSKFMYSSRSGVINHKIITCVAVRSGEKEREKDKSIIN